MDLTIISGHLGRDPETRTFDNGSAVCNFSVAVDQSYKDRDGNKVEKTKWVRVSVWGGLGSVCQQYLTKGREVTVTGVSDASAYINEAGEAVPSNELRARDVKFHGRGNDNAGQAAPQATEEDFAF